jgi:hypothetical protein
MGSYGRAAVPAEFYDKTTDMLLAQPEPQYLYAMLFLSAMGLSLNPEASMGLPGRAITGVGGAYVPADRDRLMLSNPLMNSLIAAKFDFNAAPGSTIRINRPVFANTTYTESSRRITTSISTTPITIGSQQTNLQLFKYGGPYDQSNSRVAPYGINAFDANMGVHNAVSMHGTHLVRDFHRFIDAVEVSLLDLAATVVRPSGMLTDNTPTTAGSFPMTLAVINDVEAQMDTANLPTFADGFRALVLTPVQLQQLKNDGQYKKASQFFPEYNILFPQYVKSVGKFHIFRGNTNTVSANSSSINIHYGHAISPGVLLGGMGRRPRIMPATDDDYGENVKVVWLADLAFGLANNSFVYSVRTSA